jgi:c-di-GMP-related signal transduction protein
MSSTTEPSFADTGSQPSSISSDEAAALGDGLIARQAIVDDKRAVVGYELFDRSIGARQHSASTDANMLFNALSGADSEALTGRTTVFINCTHESLAGGHLELIHPRKVVLEIPIVANDDPEQIEALVPVLEAVAKRGLRIALNQAALRKPYIRWLPFAAFIKLEMNAFGPEMAEPLVRFVKNNTKARIIAEKVETAEQHQRMADLGVKLFQGYWFARPSVVQSRTVRPSQATVIQLLNLVRRQADVSEIEEVLKRDPTLSFNLLRFINSSGFGLSVEITSFRHAVMILGHNKLLRWAALLMTSASNGAPAALGTTAVVRGRLTELLAAELLPPEDADNAFIVGVFSLLDAMLGMPLDKALDAVSLPQSVQDALLRRTGVFAPFLELAEACESGDEVAFGRAAEALHLSSRQVNMAHMNALLFAESLEG